jgi:hypothetical protein
MGGKALPRNKGVSGQVKQGNCGVADDGLSLSRVREMEDRRS